MEKLFDDIDHFDIRDYDSYAQPKDHSTFILVSIIIIGAIVTLGLIICIIYCYVKI